MPSPQLLMTLTWCARFLRTVPAIAAFTMISRSLPAVEGAAEAIQQISSVNQPVYIRVIRFIGMTPFRTLAGATIGAIRGASNNQAPTSSSRLVLQILKSDDGYQLLPGPEFGQYLQSVGVKVIVIIVTATITYIIVSVIVKVIIHYIDLRVQAQKTITTDSVDKNNKVNYQY